MDPVVDELPTENEVVEKLKNSLSAHPGHDSQRDVLDSRLVAQHREVIQRLERHEEMLRKILLSQDCSVSKTFSQQSMKSRRRSSAGIRDPRSLETMQKLASITKEQPPDIKSDNSESVGPASNNSSVRLFKSYSAHDIDLKEEAQAVHAKHSKKQVRKKLDSAVGQSVLLTKRTSQRLRLIVQHPAFDIFFAAVVFINALFIGFEVQSSIAGDWLPPRLPQVVNYVFAALFTLELFGRICFGGSNFCHSEDWMWNLLDVFVVTSSLTEIAIDIAAAIQEGDGMYEDLNSVSGLKVFRIVRLTKVIKAVRLVRVFRFVIALRTLVTSIAHTLKALFWALTLLCMIVYVFAVLFCQAVHDHVMDAGAPALTEAEDMARIKYFGSLPDTMLSLFMSIAGGVSWEDVIFPLKAVHIVWVFCFLFYVSFTYFAVLNVVTGVFCQSAIENAQKDHAAVVQNILDNKESHLKKIKALFTKIGADDTGIITFEMLQEQFRAPAVKEYFESLGLDVSDAWSFFKLLDADGGGSVEVEEFLLGCLRLRGQARAMDIAKLSFDQHWLIKNQGKFQNFVEGELQALMAEVKMVRLMDRS
eukprot:symbB.v1.2.005135.t1/scaffold226.1/size261315/14